MDEELHDVVIVVNDFHVLGNQISFISHRRIDFSHDLFKQHP